MYFLNGKSLKKKKKRIIPLGEGLPLAPPSKDQLVLLDVGLPTPPCVGEHGTSCGKGRWVPFWKGYRRARWGAYARMSLLPLAPETEQTQETAALAFIHQVITERPRGAPFCTLELP